MEQESFYYVNSSQQQLSIARKERNIKEEEINKLKSILKVIEKVFYSKISILLKLLGCKI